MREKEERERQQVKAARIRASKRGVAPAQTSEITITETTTSGVPSVTPTLATGDDPTGEPTSWSAPTAASATFETQTGAYSVAGMSPSLFLLLRVLTCIRENIQLLDGSGAS